MSRTRLPPTPAMSGELIIKDQPTVDMPDASFALPPAALSPAGREGQSKPTGRKDSIASYVPASPTSPELTALGRTTSNLPRQAGTKRALDEFNLPPPPTRTRKIIQMKPKTQQSPPKSSTPASTAKQTKETVAKSATTTTTTSPPTASTTKRKQPSASSAAGRKIARKTAHSLIERRRRSKMNEEFGTLKDMIPACQGQEMHKLAILQASIDYVNYLEQCITDLKSASGRTTVMPPPGPPSPTSPEVVAGMGESGASAGGLSSPSPELLASGLQSAQYSPSFSPRNQGYPQRQPSLDFPSPALGPTHYPPETLRSPSYHPWRTPGQPASASASPAILPQQHRASLSSSYGADADIDHEASAALLMLNMDRRGTVDSVKSVQTTSDRSSSETLLPQEKQKKMGMSVRDLLVS